MASLPPFIMTSEQGSFARSTIKERKPMILDRILVDFDYTPEIRNALKKFKEELRHEPIRLLIEKTSDQEIWLEDLRPWQGKSWLEIPWFLAEAYFYRRVLEIVQYFQPGPWFKIDPYRILKDKELISAIKVFVDIQPSKQPTASLEDFQNACYRALWGNRGDLSNLKVFETDMGAQHENIILNQSEEAYAFLKRKPAKIAYFMDNAGKELLFDLSLIDFLLQSDLAHSVTCYLKNQPFFVSDVMPKDLMQSIHMLSTSEKSWVQDLSKRLTNALHSLRLTIEAPPYFTSGRMYRRMPQVLGKQVAEHDLVILKGDVNYRRLFGDRHWDPTTPVSYAADYFPTSFLSLRTLKGEIILGVTEEILDKIRQESDPDWLINGKRGMITFQHK